VFADDLSMGGAAAAYGDIVTRARQALAAGCDMLPVCNNRASVVTLLEGLGVEPEPTSRLRLVRMHGKAMGEHGKGAVSRQELTSLPEWRRSRELLARCTAAPTLNLEAGSS
jgi:beta-N-acetylhexosaminidase